MRGHRPVDHRHCVALIQRFGRDKAGQSPVSLITFPEKGPKHMTESTLDQKLNRIRAGRYRRADFIIADAKDADMGFGLIAPGPDGRGRFKGRDQYLEAMTAMTRSGLVDVILMSASSAEVLVKRGVFKNSKVTPAVRLNDASDIWSQRGSTYRDHAARPFATAEPAQASKISDLGLYSVTFSNDVEHDRETLQIYRAFRAEAAKYKLRHFLEVFNPAFDVGLKGAEIGEYINDCIIRTLAGVTAADRPLFLKVQYNGAKAMEELASYDPQGLIVGVLGGSKGTTRDTFELALRSERHGARVALFGRKINLAEAPLDVVALMRRVVEDDISSLDAVKNYHDGLEKAGVKPHRPLKDDLEITETILKS
jgi:DhnA family fructose-bisphosphate aldolase class Ia